jgi:predicted phosphodiesterase
LIINLVVPDPHTGPDQNLRRFDWLGRLIVERRPDVITSLGDFVTFEALSNWDMSKPLLMEGRRVKKDLDAANDARDRMLTPLVELQEKQRRLKERIYRPRLIWIEGNHEERGQRYIELNPILDGFLNLHEYLKLRERGFTDIVPYRGYAEVEGTQFTHAPMNGANQPVGGKYALFRAAEMVSRSLVFGHTHRAEGVNLKRHGNDDIIQIRTSGAFFEHTDGYADGAQNHYWRGVEILTHWAPGRFDAEQLSMNRLEAEYGD